MSSGKPAVGKAGENEETTKFQLVTSGKGGFGFCLYVAAEHFLPAKRHLFPGELIRHFMPS